LTDDKGSKEYLGCDYKGEVRVGGATSHTHGDGGRVGGRSHGQEQILCPHLDVDLVVRIGVNLVSVKQRALYLFDGFS
jgi:hypothetical protein